jgi:hypothetical protein
MLTSDLRLCLGWMCVAASSCSVPDLQIVEMRDESMNTPASPSVPSELPDAAVSDSGQEPVAGRSARNTSGSAGAPARNNMADAGARPVAGSGSAGAATSGSGGASGAPASDAGMRELDAGAPPTTPPEPSNQPNPCLVWMRVSSFDRAPANAVQGGLETTAGIDSRQYVCRVKPPNLDYPVLGKAIFGNGCLAAYRLDGTMRTHNQQNGSPFEVLTAGPGCTFTWEKADNENLPSGALDLSDPPGGNLYACHGDFDGPLSSGVQVGGVQGTTDTPPRYECWFESYTSPMQPLNPAAFEVLTQVP